MERLLGLGHCWPNHAFFLAVLIPAWEHTEPFKCHSKKKMDESHLCEHKIQILCQRLRITLGSKKQQLSQAFHAEMNINLESKEDL